MMTNLPVALTIILLFTAVALLAQLLIRRAVHYEILEENTRVVEPLLGVVGTLFSVLLGFMVAAAMDRYHDMSTTVDMEANSVSDVFRVSRGLQPLDKVRINRFIVHYVNSVLDEEWKLMETAESSSRAWNAYDLLWESVLAIDPGSSNHMSNLQQSLLESMQQVGESRRLRLVACEHGLSEMQWIVILLGGGITTLFCLFFPVKRLSFHLVLTTLVTLSLGLNVWLLWAYSNPFKGELKIRPYMFDLLRTRALQVLKNQINSRVPAIEANKVSRILSGADSQPKSAEAEKLSGELSNVESAKVEK